MLWGNPVGIYKGRQKVILPRAERIARLPLDSLVVCTGEISLLMMKQQ